jgi:hypothetical protein
MCPVPHYFVTMDIESANPLLLPVDKLASLVRAAILLAFRSVALRAPLASPYPSRNFTALRVKK